MTTILTADKPQTLREFTDTNYAQASFCFDRLLKDREIKVNGKKTGENVRLQTGDCVQYFLTEKQARKQAYEVLFEDERVCIVDKESGVNVEAVYADLLRKDGEYRFIHRLDRNTCGLLAFARTDGAERALLQTFRERTAEKKYHVVCWGAFPEKHDVLTAYLQKDERRALVKIYDTPRTGTERIVTEYRTLYERDGQTKAEIILHTGKTHQIRAHLAHIGCPVVGDMKYGDAAANRTLGAARQRLVAKSLRFRFSGELSYLDGKEFLSRFDVDTLEKKADKKA